MRLSLLGVVLLLCSLSCRAGAQSATSDHHAWAVLATGDAKTPALLVHLPPRAAQDDATRGAPAGSLRKVQTFSAMPLGLAAAERDVILAFAAQADGAAKRQVLSTSARPAEAFGQWYYEPVGRLRTLAPVPDDGELLDFAQGAPGPVALLRHGGPESASYQVLMLHDDRWRSLPFPTLAPDDVPQLVGDGRGVSVVVRRAEETIWWRARVSPPAPLLAPADEPAPPLEATWNPVSLAPAPEGAAVWFFVMNEGLLAIARTPDAHHLDRLLPGRRLPLARIDGAPDSAVPVPMRESDGLALLWVDAATSAPQMLEFSTLTGELRHQGPARLSGPVSPGEFRVIALAMVVVMTVILLFLLRRDPEHIAVRLPAEAALCPPLLRLAAAGVDMVLTLVITALILGVSVGDLLSVRMLASDEPARWGIFLAVGLGWTGATLTEGLFGVTPGKFLVGARVVRIDGTLVPVGLARAAVRNACKWLAPPLAMLAAFSPDFRHRGDVLSGACVAVRRPAAPAPPPPDR